MANTNAQVALNSAAILMAGNRHDYHGEGIIHTAEIFLRWLDEQDNSE